MTIFYYYLSSKDVATSTLSSHSSSSLLLNHQQKHGSSWSSQVYSILPNSSKRMDTLMASSVGSYDIISSTINLMIHYETIWWIHANINEYKETQTFVFPPRGRRIFSLIQHPSSSLLLLVQQEMKQYLIEFGNRILPPVFDHQLSMLVMYLIQKLILPIFASKETCLKLTQHPFYTSKSIMYGNDGGSSSLALSSSSSSSSSSVGVGGLVGNSSSSSSPRTTTPDRVTASMEIIAVSLWSNAIFFMSHYIVNRLRAIYQIKKRQWERQRQQRLQRQTSRTINASGREVVVIVVDDDDNNDQEVTEHNNSNNDTTTTDILSMDQYWNLSLGSFWLSNWDLLKQSWQRYYYSAFGSGIGSMLFGAGWGTLIGLGIGDAYASTILLQSSSTTTIDGGEEGRSSSTTSTNTTDYHHHHPFLRTVSSLLDRLVVSPKKKSNVDNNNNKSHDDESTTTSKKDELLTCGCCQIVTFSSHNNNNNLNNNNSKRLPISSRVCDHTICKGCVEQCQIALMERTSNYEEWIKCPLCNAPKAYNCYDHLINRSLCNAITLIEEHEEEKNKDGNNNNAGNKKDSDETE